MSDTVYTAKSLNTPLNEILGPTGLSFTLGNQAASILNGTFDYKVTSFNGGESTAQETLSNVVATGSDVQIYFGLVGEATDYKLYRSPASGNNFVFVAEGTGSPLVDLAQNSGNLIPTNNTTNNIDRGLGTLPTVFYTAAKKTLVKEILISSDNADSVSFDIYFVRNGEQPNHANKIFKGVSLEQNETKIISLNTILEIGDYISAAGSTVGDVRGFGVITPKFSGIEIE